MRPGLRARFLGLAGSVLLAAALAAWLAPAQSAASARPLVPPALQEATPQPAQQPLLNDYCLGCHGNPDLVMELENGDRLSLYVSPDDYAHSIHARQPDITCAACHTNITTYPHPPFSAADRRDAALQLYPACRECHADQFAEVQDSVHEAARAAGNRQAAVCTDCHTAHNVRQLTDPASGQLLPEARVWIPQTCAQCHSAIYAKYQESVHGAALIEEGNQDVPTCVECHGVHRIEDPTTTSFRLRSPEICAGCHTDPAIMDKYGISTQVLNTYVADFHGTTITLFEKQHPDQESNKPVCYDCHGVHDIVRPDDPVRGLQVKSNLLARCKACHPEASANFPEAWMSHYIPSATRYPLVFTVNVFYSIFIPAVLGGMGLLVLLDLSSLVRQRLGKGRRAAPETEAAAPAAGGEETRAAEPEGDRPAAESAAAESPPEAVPWEPEPGETPAVRAEQGEAPIPPERTPDEQPAGEETPAAQEQPAAEEQPAEDSGAEENHPDEDEEPGNG